MSTIGDCMSLWITACAMASLHFASRRLAVKGAIGRQLQRDKHLVAYRALRLGLQHLSMSRHLAGNLS